LKVGFETLQIVCFYKKISSKWQKPDYFPNSSINVPATTPSKHIALKRIFFSRKMIAPTANETTTPDLRTVEGREIIASGSESAKK
jgi:hypothetical protein